ncbi:MAG: hypothetical protein WBO16_17440 [Gammaproteobacteria bacterium]|jgi:hypothetical protein
MNIVLDRTSSGKRSKSNLQARFDRLQQQLQKQQKLNQKFRAELDELVTIYHTEVSQMDRELVTPLTQLAAKLIDFYSRKSLSQWHRDELGEWVVENITRIGHVEANSAEELYKRFREVVAGQMGMNDAELDEEMRRQDEAFETSEDTESVFDADDPQEDMFGFDELFEEGTADEDFFYDHETSSREAKDTKERRQRLVDGTWVRNLFRRAAQALHPDREQDPEQRQARERSMQQLLVARKQGDIMTLLHLYSEHADGGELVLAKQEMTSACELLEQQLDELRAEKAELIYQHPLHMLVHDLFYSSSRKIREKRIRAWKQDLKAESERILNLVEELRNLKVLKAVLEERREERLFGDLDMMIDHLWQ